jgi:hypothetical protein
MNTNSTATQPLTKRCTKCGTSKPLDAFNRDANRPDGRRTYCRACHQLMNYRAPVRTLDNPPTLQDFSNIVNSLPTDEMRAKFSMAIINAMANVIERYTNKSGNQ